MFRRSMSMALVALFGSISASTCHAQYVLTAGTGAGAAGDGIEIAVSLDADSPIRGFSLGLAHDGDALTLDSIAEGAALADFNSGAGPDYFAVDVDPEVGIGGWIGCVFSLDSPIEELDAGTDLELAVFTYSVASSATPGSSIALDFSNDLGDPPVRTIVSTGSSFEPTTESGAVDILTPAVANLACAISNPCDCTITVSWENPIAFDAIRVLQDGVEVAALAGTATEFSTTLAGGGSAEFSVIPSFGTLEGPASLCTIDCVPLEFSAPENLTCTDAGGGDVTVAWDNTQSYDAVDLYLDGVLAGTVAGASESATVGLDDLELHEICIDALGDCAPMGTDLCCEIQLTELGTPFQRGDIDGSGGVTALLDALALLNWTFLGGATPPCLDAADVDDNGSVFALVDALSLLTWAFIGGTAPPDPGPTACGIDPTDDAVECDTISPACD